MICLLFDLDGTITDPELGITSAVQYAAKKLGFDAPDRTVFRDFIGPPLRKSFAERFSLTEEQAETAVKYYREYYRPKGIFECVLYPGIEKALEEFDRLGYSLGIATVKPEIFAEKIMDHFGLTKRFRFISGSELDNSRDDKADVILRAMENINGSTKENTVMIGDRSYDMIAAKKVGIKCIGANYGYGSEEELREAGADATADSPCEIRSALEKLDLKK
ncbi:MAG: HAD hydrolase-like protein [Clostridia bacterium]|nr:HAD hydrolase-like protein [Clostridia bacterium]MBQ3869255.1 HAD hydrolase-like protein [Clostridia bacterium]